jgi:hypothetical protein
VLLSGRLLAGVGLGPGLAGDPAEPAGIVACSPVAHAGVRIAVSSAKASAYSPRSSTTSPKLAP